jgi:hypothetical protein
MFSDIRDAFLALFVTAILLNGAIRLYLAQDIPLILAISNHLLATMGLMAAGVGAMIFGGNVVNIFNTMRKGGSK